MTLGEERVRRNFNPGARQDVEEIKRRTAELIDFCQDLRNKTYHGDPELMRLISLAQTHYEDAAMWAVKAATFNA